MFHQVRVCDLELKRLDLYLSEEVVKVYVSVPWFPNIQDGDNNIPYFIGSEDLMSLMSLITHGKPLLAPGLK